MTKKTISVGDTLPEATFLHLTQEGLAALSDGDVFSDKKVVLFAVPGAFTPTCHHKHLPGFINNAQELKARGIDTIACVSVNDPFVMAAWAAVTNSGNDIQFLADPDANFAAAIGMDVDRSAAGMGRRSMRYAMLVENGEVKVLNIESGPGQAEESSAEEILKAL
jgi:glutaredoxin/glutathione-dependent peroxiredoxin